MRIGVISDIHGNLEALNSVLTEIDRVGVDQIICLGDVIDPLPQSRATLQLLWDRQIPIIRGNHEDYVISAREDATDPISYAPNWEPVRQIAVDFDRELIDRLKALPLSISIADTQAGELLLCHASPLSNRLGWLTDVSDALAQELEQETARTIICGHWHRQETRPWRDKTLVINGSVGIPLSGRQHAEFSILEATPQGWRVEHRSTPYDYEATLKIYRESGLVARGGPMAWIIYDEIRTARIKMAPFFVWVRNHHREIDTRDDLLRATRDYLREQGSWDDLQHAILEWPLNSSALF